MKLKPTKIDSVLTYVKRWLINLPVGSHIELRTTTALILAFNNQIEDVRTLTLFHLDSRGN